MSMIKIEFPADRPDIAKILGEAIISISERGGVKIETDRPDVHSITSPAPAVSGEVGENLEKVVGDFVASVANGSDDHGQFTKDELEEQKNLVDPANTDTKGVPFNAEFCGNAAKPFYASGKRSGQWKKRQGVDELVYDNWYAAELAKVAPVATGQDSQQAAVNTASAFGGQQQPGGDVNAAGANTGEVVPHDAGTLMAWVSEMQAAGHITQEQVNTAYQQAGVTMTDVFPGPNKTEGTIAQAVRNVHIILASWIVW